VTIQGVPIARVSTVPFFVVTQLSAQLQALHQAGADVHVIASDDGMGDALHGMDYVRFVPVSIPREISPFRDLLSLIHLTLVFRRGRYKIVHSTTPKAGLLTALAGLLAGVPVRLHTYTGQPWVTMKGLKKAILIGCDRLIGKLNTHAYTDSHSQRDFLINAGVVAPSKLSVIGSGSLAGVDVERFDVQRFNSCDKQALRAALGIPDTSKVVLFVGRVTRDKGIVELLKAHLQLLEAGEEVYLLMVGPDEADGLDIVRVLGGGGHSDHIKLVGFSAEPEKYMAISDLLCLPSYREGFGTVVIEAAAMGLPTVGTAIYGLTDAVVEGKTGLLVPVGDDRALAHALSSLLQDPDKLRAMSANARERARNEFDSKRLSALLIEQYEGFLNGR